MTDVAAPQTAAARDADGAPQEPETFPQLLADMARRRPDAQAMREKRYGIWQSMTFAEVHARV
jgi:long-subunit acyl-CoA synthetase (AMP-forming)